MRLYSTKKSVIKGEVSLLAVLETIVAIALVFFLSAHFNTIGWLAVAICISPLLLLRTRKSKRLGIKLVDEWVEKRSKSRQESKIIDTIGRQTTVLKRLEWLLIPATFIVLAYSVIELSFIVLTARLAATIVSTIRAPLDALRSIPTNWARVTLATDFRFPPEVVPGHRSMMQFDEMVGESGFSSIINPCFWVLLPLFLPSLFYRWSLKATSIIYAPLVFIVHTTFRHVRDLRLKLELIKRSDLTRIRVFYGSIFITLFLFKLVLMNKLPNFVEWWNGHPITKFLALYVAPSEIPKWQLASLINSILALAMMIFVRETLMRIELGMPWPEVMVKRILGFVSGVRWVLALYTIFCTGYITIQAARNWNWPLLGSRWFPW